MPRRNNGVDECQLMIEYRGLIKLARRSGEIKSIAANVVRAGDEFHYEYGLEHDVLRHVPGDGTGELQYAYAVARYMNGGVDFVVLSASQIEARRKVSPSGGSDYGPWAKMFFPTDPATDFMHKLMKIGAVAKMETGSPAPSSLNSQPSTLNHHPALRSLRLGAGPARGANHHGQRQLLRLRAKLLHRVQPGV